MSLMDKILETAGIMWGISMVVANLAILIGSVAKRDVIVNASLIFMGILFGLAALAFCIWGFAGIWMYLQEIWG